MRPFSLLVTVFAFAILSGPAKAAPPSSALFGSVNGTPVAVYAQDSGFGTCFMMDEQINGQWVNWYQQFCNTSQADLDAHGGAVGFITYMLPNLNQGLANHFVGAGVSGQLNSGLTTAFKFSGAALVPK